MLGGAVAAGPLAALAARHGRRVSLAAGSLIALCGTLTLIIGGVQQSLAVVLPGFLVLGVGSAVNLQARFAATDLAAPGRRGRDLSLVVWMTTIGVVVGPQLIQVGDSLGAAWSLPPLVGTYVIAAAAQLCTSLVLALFLRPDPLLLARPKAHTEAASSVAARLRLREHPRALAAIAVVSSGSAVMVGVMALTPVHMHHGGSTLTTIGIAMSVHTAGMYALSPLFGWLSDRFGRSAVALGGFATLVAALAAGALLPGELAVIGLALLGLGWSAVMVAGSAMVTDAAPAHLSTALQGRSDTVMGVAAASAGAAAGPLVALVGFAGLNLMMLAVVAVGAFALLRTAPSGAVQ